MADYKVKGLAIKRDGNKYTASWTVPSGTKKHITGMDVDSKRDRAGATDKWKSEYDGSSTAKTSQKLDFTRSDYYPYNGKKKLSSISVRVRGKKKGGHYSYVTETYDFAVPKVPSVSLSVNDLHDTLTATVKADEGAGKRERYDTVVDWDFRQCVGGKTKGWTALKGAETSTAQEFTKSSGDLSASSGKKVTALADSDWVQVRCRARSRGLKGASEWSAWRYHMFAQPAKPVLGTPTLTSNQVIIPVTIKGTTIGSKAAGYANAHPVDSVQLYRYIGTSMAANVGDWTEVDGAADDGDCTGMHDARANAEPSETGQRVWYRVKAVHDGYEVWSEPVECAGLYKHADTSAGAAATVDSVTDNGDGESVNVAISWGADAASAYDTTVVGWSQDQDAWQSTDEPDTFEMDDVTWATGRKVTVKVTGLEDGGLYWFRARRISSANDQKGAWSAAVSCGVSSTPGVPTLTAPAAVRRGEGFTVSWASGQGVQSAWRLLCLNSTAGSGAAHEVVLAEGSGAAASATVAAGDSRLDVLDSAELAVEVSTGGDYVRSGSVSVALQDAPTATVACERTVTASGHAVTVTVEPTGALFDVAMTASGCTSALPDGSDRQLAGDVVWAENGLTCGEGGSIELTVPGTAHLIDGARYRITVTPYSGTLSGEAVTPAWTLTDDDGAEYVTDELEVAWAHQAAAPEACSIAVDGDARSATVTPTVPEGAAETDTWSLYRATPDGYAAIAEGMAFGASATDPTAPFAADGACAYRVATFTADGDCDWMDFEYAHACRAVRIDWEGGSVELPYNIELSDSYSKAFAASSFLDEGAQGGSWGASVARRLSISAALPAGDARVPSLRELARHSGACFCRMPDGCAFECDCQVTGIDTSPGIVSVSLDVTETALSAFKAVM